MMKEQDYDIQSVRQYLLGSLADTEAERYDELSFADNGFNDFLRSVEDDLVDSYVSGELSGDDLERFRDHYLASPRRRSKVDFAKEFRGFVAREYADRSVKDDENTKRGYLGIFFLPSLKWGLSAASLALVFVCGWLWVQNSRLQLEMSGLAANSNLSLQKQQDLEKQITALKEVAGQTDQEISSATEDRDRLQRELDEARAQSRAVEVNTNVGSRPATRSSAPSVVASFVLMPSLRGSAQLQRLSIPSNTSRVMLRLKLEPNDFNSYSAVLRDPDTGKSLWRNSRLRPLRQGDSASVSISIPASLLTSKVYTLSLSGLVHSGPPESFSDYTFQVVR